MIKANLSQPANAAPPILITSAGMSIRVSDVLANDSFPKCVICLGRIMLDNLLQSAKHPSEMRDTPSGMLIADRLLHSAKA